jgi:hypothetical protein
MPTIKIDFGSDCTGLTLTMHGKVAATDYYILASDGTSEPYNSEHEADYQHAGTEPDRPGEYAFTISDNIEADMPIIFRVEDEEGNKWAEEVLIYDGETFNVLVADAAKVRIVADKLDSMITTS